MDRLATELILMIANDVGPGDRFNLSQTNRRLRDVFMQEDWKGSLSGLSYDKRLQFWTTVTRGHPHLVVDRSALVKNLPCIRQLDYKDIPRFIYSYHMIQDPVDFLSNSTFRRHHVRTALKLHRLDPAPNELRGLKAESMSQGKGWSKIRSLFMEYQTPWTAEQRYLRSIMHALSSQGKIYHSIGTVSVEIEAKIINGRFLFRIDWRLPKKYLVFPWHNGPSFSGYLCPHLRWQMHDYQPGIARVPISDSLSLDYINPITNPISKPYCPGRLYQERGGCDSCLTDYTMCIEGRERCALRVWYDLGEEKDEDDICFTAHLETGTKAIRQFGSSRRKHGTVRKLFEI